MRLGKVSKLRVPKVVYKTIISIVVLLVLIVGAGVAYTWYMGQNAAENTSAIATPVEVEPTPTIKHVKPAPNAKVGASVHTLTSPVAPGSNASITVGTNPDLKCTIKVEYNKVASTDSGLSPKIADEYGIVSWTWTVEESVPLGKWPVQVTCANKENSAMVQGDLIVKQGS